MKNEITRRAFLKAGSAAAIAGGVVVGTPEGQGKQGSSTKYEAEVPDTLDLAERAALSVNSLTGAANPERGYETYLTNHLDHRPPYMKHMRPGVCLQIPLFGPHSWEGGWWPLPPTRSIAISTGTSTA